MWGPTIAMVHTVCPSVVLSHVNISETKQDRPTVTGKSNRNPGFPIPNLPSDSRSEVRFHHFGCLWVAFYNKLYAVAPYGKKNQDLEKSNWAYPGANFAQNTNELL